MQDRDIGSEFFDTVWDFGVSYQPAERLDVLTVAREIHDEYIRYTRFGGSKYSFACRESSRG